MSVDAKFIVYGSQIQKWTDDIQTLGKQCDQLKIERDKLEAQKISFERSYKQVVEENDKLKDLNEALKFSENMNWHSSREFEQERDELAKENKALRLQANTYFDE